MAQEHPVLTGLRWILENRRRPNGNLWSASALSQAAGLARSHIPNIVSGTQGADIKWETATAIARVANVRTTWLMTGQGEREPYESGETPVAPPVSTERPHARQGDGLASVPHFEPPDWVMTPLLKAVQKHPELDVSNALIKATAWALARDSAKREQQLDVRECEQALLIAADLVAEGVDISANPLEIMYESLRRAHRADPRTARNDAAFEAALAAEREDPSRQRPPRKGAKGGGRA